MSFRLPAADTSVYQSSSSANFETAPTCSVYPATASWNAHTSTVLPFNYVPQPTLAELSQFTGSFPPTGSYPSQPFGLMNQNLNPVAKYPTLFWMPGVPPQAGPSTNQEQIGPATSSARTSKRTPKARKPRNKKAKPPNQDPPLANGKRKLPEPQGHDTGASLPKRRRPYTSAKDGTESNPAIQSSNFGTSASLNKSETRATDLLPFQPLVQPNFGVQYCFPQGGQNISHPPQQHVTTGMGRWIDSVPDLLPGSPELHVQGGNPAVMRNRPPNSVKLTFSSPLQVSTGQKLSVFYGSTLATIILGSRAAEVLLPGSFMSDDSDQLVFVTHWERKALLLALMKAISLSKNNTAIKLMSSLQQYSTKQTHVASNETATFQEGNIVGTTPEHQANPPTASSPQQGQSTTNYGEKVQKSSEHFLSRNESLSGTTASADSIVMAHEKSQGKCHMVTTSASNTSSAFDDHDPSKLESLVVAQLCVHTSLLQKGNPVDDHADTSPVSLVPQSNTDKYGMLWDMDETDDLIGAEGEIDTSLQNESLEEDPKGVNIYSAAQDPGGDYLDDSDNFGAIEPFQEGFPSTFLNDHDANAPSHVDIGFSTAPDDDGFTDLLHQMLGNYLGNDSSVNSQIDINMLSSVIDDFEATEQAEPVTAAIPIEDKAGLPNAGTTTILEDFSDPHRVDEGIVDNTIITSLPEDYLGSFSECGTEQFTVDHIDLLNRLCDPSCRQELHFGVGLGDRNSKSSIDAFPSQTVRGCSDGGAVAVPPGTLTEWLNHSVDPFDGMWDPTLPGNATDLLAVLQDRVVESDAS